MDSYNPILDSDSYKMSHFHAYPSDVTKVSSYAESRGGEYEDVMFFGLQPYIDKIATNPVTLDHIGEAEHFAHLHGTPFNKEGWSSIVRYHGGFLPLRISAIPEGMVLPYRNALCTVENTNHEHAWLTSHIETPLLRNVWYGSTFATRIFGMKRKLKDRFEQSGDLANLPFALLDFSARGCTSYDANELGGAAYLAHFMGSDSLPAVRFTNHHYHSPMSGFSIPATEHSVMCSWGEVREEEAILEIVRRFGGQGKIVSIVADTWDVFRAAGYCAKHADAIKATGTTLVFRPDSGDMDYVIPHVLKTLADGFGTTRNSKGYEVLNGVKLLWGDGIDEETCAEPFFIAAQMGISADSIVVGSGGGLMQKNINRDTCKFAFKASAIEQGRVWKGIAKDPITDPGKRSKMGKVAVVPTATGFETKTYLGAAPVNDIMKPYYINGYLPRRAELDSIRSLVDSQL